MHDIYSHAHQVVTETAEKPVVPKVECPHCHTWASVVIDSRPSASGYSRRRECAACHRRFTTIEVVHSAA